MRVKIKGEITASRLEKAFQKAVEKYEAVRPGAKIYGANLYLTAYDADGLPFDLADQRGESLFITIEADSGEIVKPALTAEGEWRRQQAHQAKEEACAAAERLEKETLEKYAKIKRERQEQEAKARETFKGLNEATAKRIQNDPENFINELNSAIQTAWQKCQPLAKHGTQKGLPLALPTFSLHADGLLLSVKTRTHPRRVLNPICTLQHGEITSFWMHEAWDEATRQIRKVLHTTSEAN